MRKRIAAPPQPKAATRTPVRATSNTPPQPKQASSPTQMPYFGYTGLRDLTQVPAAPSERTGAGPGDVQSDASSTRVLGTGGRSATSTVLMEESEEEQVKLQRYLQVDHNRQTGFRPSPQEQARQVPQANTLSQHQSSGAVLDEPSLEITRWNQTNFLDGAPEESIAWFAVKMLGRYQNQIYESARANRIPPQLLATVILNELADIDPMDVLQAYSDVGSMVRGRGSVGIAQINFQDQDLLEVSDLEAKAAYDGSIFARIPEWQYSTLEGIGLRYASPDELGPSDNVRIALGRQLASKQKLELPQYSIEAAARKIARLLKLMTENADKDWQKRHHFSGEPAQGLEYIHRIKYPLNPGGKERTLAALVVGAYNTEKIITEATEAGLDPLRVEEELEQNKPGWGQAVAHSSRARDISDALYYYGLFHE